MRILTFEELCRKQAEGLMASEKAVSEKLDTYKAIKRLIHEINAGPVDVSDYYPLAVRLGALLHEMKAGFGNTIFHYFADHIDPVKKGDVRCFRMECRQLSEQMKMLDDRRARQRSLKIVRKQLK